MLSKLELSSADEILDSSAGTGLLAESLLKRYGTFQKLVLNDPSPKMLERAKYRLRYQEEIEFTNQLSEEFTFPDQSFTQIICLNSFHYYVEQEKVLTHFHRMLKSKGNLWLLDWNRTGTFKIANTFIDWLSPEHINSRSLPEMKELLREAEFKIKEEDSWGYRWWNFFFFKCTLR